MTESKKNRSCKYEGGMVCFYTSECTFPSLITCLQQNLYLAQKEISLLKEKRNLRHTKVSIKWRNNSFYYKKKLKYLEEWIKGKGLSVPKIEELFLKETVNLESKDITEAILPEEGEKDVGLRDSNSTGVSETRGDPVTGSK